MTKQGSATGSERRRGRTDEQIRRATLDLLRTKGPQSVTVEAVAATSGVAKTTIYRRFANRREMLQAALVELTEVPKPAPEVPTREKMRWVLASTREALEDGLGLSSVGALLAGQDPEFSESLRAVLAPYFDQLATLMGSAIAAGNVRAQIDPDSVLSMVLGACLGEQLRFGHVRDEWLDHTLEALWSGIGAR